MRARLGSFALAAFAAAVVSAPVASAAVTGYVVNSDGQPIAGAKVSLLAPETLDARRARLVSATPERPALASAESGSSGKFSVEAPKDAPAVVTLRVEARGYAPATQSIERDDDVSAIALSAAAEKRGTITAAGKPVAKATVIWSGGGVNEVFATTDGEGHYTVPDPQRWASHLTILHPDFAPVDADFAPFDGSRPQPDRSLVPGVALSGRVVGDDGKTPVAKADIFVGDLRLATSADDGTFSIAHLPANWETLTARTAALVGSRARSAGTPVTIRLARGAVVSGTVRNAKTQAAIAGAEIRLVRPILMGRAETFSSAITDAKGNYTLPAAPAGGFSTMFLRPGFNSAPVNFSAAAGQKVTKNIAASEEARVSGSVVDEEKRPIAGAVVSSMEVETERGPAAFLRGPRQPREAISAPDGRFVVRTLSDANLQINATKKGLPSATSVTLRLAPGERKSNVVLTMPRGVALSGRVVDGDGKPLSGVAVEVAQASGNPFGMVVRRIGGDGGRERDMTVRTGSDGTFSMRVREGSYDVSFSREGFAPRQVRAQQINASSKPLEVTLEPGAEVTGRVTRAGAGVEGVSVMAMTEGSQSAALTGPDGTFRLADLVPGPLMINVRKQDSFIQAMRNVTAPARDVNIDLPAGGRITGRVFDKASKNPVTSFQAGINPSRNGGGRVFVMPPQLRPFSSDDGTFVLENVPPGETQVVVNAAGYTAGRVAGLNVEDGKTISGVEVALDTGTRLTGRVTGTDGQPVSGAVVRPSTDGPMRMSPEGMATTDANGEYAIEAVEPGEKTFQIAANGYLSESRTLTLSGREARLDVQLSSGAKVTGVVVNEAGAPIGDATVVVRGAGGHMTRSDANGMFQLDGLAPGHYTFSAQRSPYADGVVRDFDISSGAPLRIVLTTGATIYGHVFGLTPNELSHAAVTASVPGSGSDAQATIDSSGNYRLEGAPTGTVRVEAQTMSGFGGVSRNTAPKSVQVGPGASVQVDLEFRNGTTVHGRVTRNGQVLANAMVDFLPRAGDTGARVQARTDNTGSYTATGLEDGSYRVLVLDVEHFTPYSSSYDVKGSGTFDIDIKAAPVRGRVTDSATGQAIADARIELRPTTNGTDFLNTRGGTTDANGGFLIDSVAPGRYQITASKSGYGNEIRDLTVTETPGDAVQLAMATNDGITLKVVDARDGRALSPLVRAYDAQGRIAYEAMNRFFGGDGATSQKLALAPGTYRVVIQMQGYATASVTLSSPSQQTIGLTPGGTLILRSSSNTPRRVRLLGENGAPYEHSLFGNGLILLDASPAVTTIYNVAPGTYTVQVLDETGKVVGGGTKVTVVEGQSVEGAL